MKNETQTTTKRADGRDNVKRKFKDMSWKNILKIMAEGKRKQTKRRKQKFGRDRPEECQKEFV